MKSRKGITLIEVILTLALISLVLALPANLFTFTKKAETLAMTEAEIQASSRLITEYVNNSNFAVVKQPMNLENSTLFDK